MSSDDLLPIDSVDDIEFTDDHTNIQIKDQDNIVEEEDVNIETVQDENENDDNNNIVADVDALLEEVVVECKIGGEGGGDEENTLHIMIADALRAQFVDSGGMPIFTADILDAVIDYCDSCGIKYNGMSDIIRYSIYALQTAAVAVEDEYILFSMFRNIRNIPVILKIFIDNDNNNNAEEALHLSERYRDRCREHNTRVLTNDVSSSYGVAKFPLIVPPTLVDTVVIPQNESIPLDLKVRCGMVRDHIDINNGFLVCGNHALVQTPLMVSPAFTIVEKYGESIVVSVLNTSSVKPIALKDVFISTTDGDNDNDNCLSQIYHPSLRPLYVHVVDKREEL